jgi:flagellar motility protein MotE (MotC chaperone)
MGVSIKESVKDRDRQAAQRNRALDLREQATRAAEERLKAGMEARQAAPKQNAEKESEDGPYESLARIYQTMKPAKAARVFEQLELDVQVQVAQRMRDRATAGILAAMSPDAAARLSMAMAGKTPRPARNAAASAGAQPQAAR